MQATLKKQNKTKKKQKQKQNQNNYQTTSQKSDIISNQYRVSQYRWLSSSSSSSCRSAITDIADPLTPLFPIVHRLWQVFRATSHILTYLLNVCSSCSFCFCPAICGGPLVYITYELAPASPAVSFMSGSSNLDCLRDGRLVSV